MCPYQRLAPCLTTDRPWLGVGMVRQPLPYDSFLRYTPVVYPGASPRSLLTVRRVRRPAFPLQYRHGYAADFRRGLLTGPVHRRRSRPSLHSDVRCIPAHIHQIGAGSGLEGVRPLVPALVHLPVLLAGPEPSGSADSSRRCQGCSRPPLRPQGQAALSFSRPLRRSAGGVLSSPHGPTAPRGARPAANRLPLTRAPRERRSKC